LIHRDALAAKPARLLAKTNITYIIPSNGERFMKCVGAIGFRIMKPGFPILALITFLCPVTTARILSA
jgi:hypothetical protein